jgi:enoyl-CoA hydratase
MSQVTVATADGIAVVTFCRPPVNATNSESWNELTAVFSAFHDRRDVRAVIFTACGTRAFMAGQDLREDPWAGSDRSPAAIVDPGRPVRDAMWAVYDCPVPVIAAVNGPAVGGGLALVALCDIIIAAERATFGATEINVGLLGASAQLSRLVGAYRAREMFFLGEMVSAEELHRLGVVRQVVPDADLLPAATGVAEKLAAKSPIALRLAKESMNRVEGMAVKDAYRLEQDYTNRLRMFDDASEATKAYLEKRPPDWLWH